MVTLNKISPLKEKLRARQPVIGVWSIMSSATAVEIGALAGLDFQILDLEHGTYDLGSLERAIVACEANGGVPIVRVPELSPTAFQSALDLGAHGIIVPRIGSAEDAVRAVDYAKYPPRGSRGYNPFTRAALYANPADNQLGKLNNDYTLVAIIIENAESYADLPRILAVPEIDVVYLGIYDMCMALGCNGNTRDPRVRAFVEDASGQILASGKALGMMVRDEKETAYALELGAIFLLCGVDTNLFLQTLQRPVAQFKAFLREQKQ